MLYVDQHDVGLYPAVSSQWGPKAKQHKVRTGGRNARSYLFGARDAHTDELLMGFWPRKDSQAFVEFLRAVLRAIPQGPIYVILDNYSVHKSKLTRQFLATEGWRFRFVFLPTYSPWLNRIEDTWRIAKGRAGTNAWRDTLVQAEAQYTDTLTHMGARLLHSAYAYSDSEE